MSQDRLAPRGGRHRRAVRGSRKSPTSVARWAQVFPALLGPGRRAAWRRFVLRRAIAVILVVTGYAIALIAGSAVPMWR